MKKRLPNLLFIALVFLSVNSVVTPAICQTKAGSNVNPSLPKPAASDNAKADTPLMNIEIGEAGNSMGFDRAPETTLPVVEAVVKQIPNRTMPGPVSQPMKIQNGLKAIK
jgi:hypothetical protein